MDRVLNWQASLADPHMREVLLGSLAGLVVKVLAAISLFAMNVVVTRAVGPTQAGLFFLAFTLVTILATVGRSGLDQAVVRFVAKDRACCGGSALQDLYRKATVWAFCFTAALAFIVYQGADWLNNSVFSLSGFDEVLKVAVIAAPFMALYIIQAQALQGLKQVSKSMCVASVTLPVIILMFVLMFGYSNAKNIAAYCIVAAVFSAVIGGYLWHQSAPKVCQPQPFASSVLRRTCMPLWTVAIVHQIIQWSSQLILGVAEDAESVAFFATAQRTAMLTSFILFAVNTIVAPKFAAMHATGDMDGIRRTAVLSVRIMLVVCVPVTAFVLIFPEWLMGMFGEAFTAAAPALMILTIGQFVNIATGSVGYLLSMTGNETKVRDNVVLAGVLSVGLGVILIPLYGVIGAAIAYACGVASQNLLGVYQVKKYLGFNTLCFWKA